MMTQWTRVAEYPVKRQARSKPPRKLMNGKFGDMFNWCRNGLPLKHREVLRHWRLLTPIRHEISVASLLTNSQGMVAAVQVRLRSIAKSPASDR